MADRACRFLSAAELERRSDPLAMVAAIDAAFAAMADGSVSVPPREHIEADGSTLLVMPASGAGLFATKLVTVVPGNAARGFPVIQGTLQLFDAANGAPLALLDAAMLTAQRTGAVAAVAVKALAAPTLDAIGIVGCGVQGAWAAIHCAAVRPIDTVHCVARSEASFARFCATVARHAPHLRLERHIDATALLAAAPCVITATTSATPVLPDDPKLLAGKLIVALGGFRPHMRELPEAAFRLADRIYVDSPQARGEAGDIAEPLAQGWVTPAQVGDFCRWLPETSPSIEGVLRIFKSVGHAAFDLFAARVFVDRVSDAMTPIGLIQP